MLHTAIAALAAGVLLVVIARHLRIPAIVPLLLGGIALGPEGLGLVQPDEFGRGLRPIIAMAVAIVLFEGAVSLEVSGYRQAPAVIRRMLTTGALVTWMGTTAAVWALFDFPLPYALVAGSLVMVTGPTVITPLLRRVHVTERLHHVLHWESVLIDPVGVFVAVLCFEFLHAPSGPSGALGFFALRILAGGAAGLGGGILLDTALRRGLIPDDLINIGVLAGVLALFGASEAMLPESGILAVVVAGLVLALRNSPQLERIRHFKEELTHMAVGILFVVLAARLRFDDFALLAREGLILIGIVLLLRPVSIVLSTWGEGFGWRERAFLSWIAPRGIVAASMASLFAIELDRAQAGSGRFLEAFTYGVIGVTVLLQGTTAGLVARLLGVQQKAREGWLIVGAHRFARDVGTFLREQLRVAVLLLDRAPAELREAERGGHIVLRADALDPSVQDRSELASVGHVLALTDNEDLNALVAHAWTGQVGPGRVYRWASSSRPHGAGAGEPVWTEHLRPSALSHQLESGVTRLVVTTGGEPPRAGDSTTLLELGDRSFDWRSRQPAEVRGEAPRLWLERRVRTLPGLLRPERIVTLGGLDVESAVRELLEAAVRDGVELDPDPVLHEIVRREGSVPTTLGHGVAVPHAYVEGLAVPVCCVGRSPVGIDFAAHDGAPVRLLFLLLGPAGNPQGHLNLLAEIATVASDRAAVEAMVHAADHREIRHTILRRLADEPRP